ncbi:MAG: recombinase RecT [Steroidobacteraceae bacterium]
MTTWIECTIERKDRSMPVSVREYLAECERDTGPWKSHPRRMLRHKALIQCARIAFGFAGVYDPDEGDRIVATIETQGHSVKPATEAPKVIEQQQPAAAAGKVYNDVASAVVDIRDALDAEGIPETSLFAKFEIGGFDELALNQVQEALNWVRNVNAQPEVRFDGAPRIPRGRASLPIGERDPAAHPGNRGDPQGHARYGRGLRDPCAPGLPPVEPGRAR